MNPPLLLPLLLALPLFTACGAPDDTDDSVEPSTFALSGGVEKGPFLLGSQVQVSPLDASGNPTGALYSTTTTNDRGEFSVTVTALPGAALDVLTSGFAFDEFDGDLAEAPTVLRALLSAGDGAEQTAYVNALTHMAHPRALRLYKDGTDLDDAIGQAQSELRAALPGVVAPAEAPEGGGTMIGADDDGNAYVLAVSCVLGHAAYVASDGQGHAAELQELVNGIGADLEADGLVQGNTSTQFSEAARDVNGVRCMEHVRERLVELGTAEPVVADVSRALDFDRDGVADAYDDDADGDGIPKASDRFVSIGGIGGSAGELAFVDSRDGSAGGQVWLLPTGGILGPHRLEKEAGVPLTGIVRAHFSDSIAAFIDVDGALWLFSGSFSGAPRKETAPAGMIDLHGAGTNGFYATTTSGDLYRICNGCGFGGASVVLDPNYSDVVVGSGGYTTFFTLQSSGVVNAYHNGSSTPAALGGLDGEVVEDIAITHNYVYVLTEDGSLYGSNGSSPASPIATPSEVLALHGEDFATLYAETASGLIRLGSSGAEPTPPAGWEEVFGAWGWSADDYGNEWYITSDGRAVSHWMPGSGGTGTAWYDVPR